MAGDKAGRLSFELPDVDGFEDATLADGFTFTFAGAAVTDPVLDEDGFAFTSLATLSEGVFQVSPRLSFPGGGLRTIDLEPVIVETFDGWLTIDATRRQWDSAPFSDAQLFRLLNLAKLQVLAYGSIDVSNGDFPEHYGDAQLAQARNLWNAARVDPANSQLGEGQFTIRPFPMDWTVKNMIRPKRAVPAVA